MTASSWALATPASAHALAVSSTPPAGATLQQPPRTITIVFSEAPDPRLSAIQVLDTSGAAHQTGRTTAVAGQPQTLQVAVGTLTPGVYTVAWRTVSRVDGHLATGSFAFGYKVTPTGAAATAGVVRSPPVSPWAVVARWMFYVGLMGLVGTAEVALIATPLKRLAALATIGWALAAAGLVALEEQQRRAIGLPLGQFWSSSLGHQVYERAVPVAAAGLLLLWVWRRPASRVAPALVGAAALAAMLGDVEDSHAAGERSWTWFRVLTQWTHFAAAGVWLGGLVVLVAVLPHLEPVRRRRASGVFSNVALAAVALIAVTGLLRGLDEIRSWHGLFSTTFGRWAIVKVLLLAGLMGLGFLNRRRGVPSTAGSAGRLLRRIGTVELGLGAVVLVAAGFLQSLAPPSATPSPKNAPPLVATGHDFATTVDVRLAATPGTAGFNRFSLRVLDYDTHAPVDGATVTLTFVLPSDPNLGPSTLTLTPQGPGEYSADAPNLAVQGTWSVTALIQRGSQSAEVPLSLTTRTIPVRIDAVRSPGLPTVYTIHATPAVSFQVYLDPGRPGLNEFHVTLIGTTDEEVPTSELAVTAGKPSPLTRLTVRRLDNIGHFVADLPGATQGNYHFSIDANSDQGPVYADITIAIS